jgi:TP901 family phage tail tape measure protein
MLGNKVLDPKSFSNTILDIQKFPQAFQLMIPTGRKTDEGEIEKAPFYVPGAQARVTYAEELIAGERGMDNITRRLTHLTNMAIELNEVLQDTEKYLGPQETQSKLKSIIGGYRKQAEELKNSSGPAAEASLEQIRSQLMGALSPTQSASPDLIGGTYAKLSELDFVNTRFQKDLSKGVSRKQALATNIGDIADVLIGKKSPSSPEQASAPTGLSRAAQYQGGLLDFGKKIGVDLEQELVDRRVTALQTAKVEYYNALAEAAVGKSGSVNELFFNKKLPAVIGKATVAVTDKSDDMAYFLEDLNSLEDEVIKALGGQYQGMFDEVVSKTKEVKKTHEDKLAKVREAGLPVLKESQVGVSSEFAARIPLDYRRAKIQEVEGVGRKVQIDQEATPGTLAGFFKDMDRLRGAADSEGLKKQVEKYIEETANVYLESVRFPFTGTSSIAPYEAKLIEEGEFGDKALHSIIAPGVPEGMEEFKIVVNKVDDMIKTMSERREQIHEGIDKGEITDTEAALGEIERLTTLMNKLNNSISEVIPKYTAKAQKLDYDGDQIELHSAKTREARMEIAKHFASFHSRTHDSVYDRAPSLEAAYRTKFLASAVEESTGKFILGEGSQAYSKKFPTGGTFLKTPFLTEDMDYMKPEEMLNALSGRDLGDLGTVMTDLIKNRVLSEKQFKSQEDMDNAYKKLSDLSEALKAIPEVNKNIFEDDKRYAKEIYEAVKASYNKDAVEVIDRVLKQKLYEEKSKDVTQAQIFKLNVGMDAESMYRLQRVAESNIGFGEGQETMPGYEPQFRASEYFKKRYPTGLESLGGKEAEHFHTMVNEFVRVAQQKGMDVKHAGQLPIAGEIAKYMSRGPSGAEELIKLVQNDKSYEDYKDFNEVVEENIRRRAGAMLTSDIKDELMGIMQSRGQDIDTMPEGRKQLIDMLVQKLNFEDFLRELALIVQKEAIEGLAAKASAWSPAKKARPGGGMSPVKGDIKDWAATEIKRQMEEGGIDIKSTFVEGKQGLSSMRTFGASTRAEYEKFREKYGDVPEPSGFLTSANVNEGMRKDYMQKYKRAYSTARNIKEEMTRFAAEDAQGGAYSEMVRGTIEGLYKQYEELLVAVEEIQRASYDPSAAKDMDLLKRLSSTDPGSIGLEGVAPFVKEMLNKKPADTQRELKKYMDITGVPDLTDREKFDVAASLAKKLEKQGKDKGMSEEEITKYVDSQTEKALIIKQMDRIIDSAISKANDLRVLEAMMPSRNAPGIIDTKMASREELAARQREQVKQMAASRRAEDFGGSGTTFPRDPGAMMAPGGVVPVHIVGANDDVTINIRGIKDLESFGVMPSRAPVPNKEIYTDLEKIYKRTGLVRSLNTPGQVKQESTREMITGSALSGGSPYKDRTKVARGIFTEESRYKDQVESLVDNMDRYQKENFTDLQRASMDWGKAIHELLQKKLNERAKKEGKDLRFEEYGSMELSDFGYPEKVIGGYADIVERDKEGKIVKITDIKTASQDKVNEFRKIIEDVLGEGAKSADISQIHDQLSIDQKRLIEDYFSQINSYLEAFGTEEGTIGEIRFHARELKGKDIDDPTSITFKKSAQTRKRFEKDMKAVAEARSILETQYGTGRFRKTTIREGGINPDVNEEVLEEIMKLSEETIASIKGPKTPTKAANVGMGYKHGGKIYHRDPEDGADDPMERAYNENVRQAEQASFREQRETMDRFRGPQPIMEGETIEAFLANMTTLHDMSKDFQTNMEKVSADNLPKEIKDLLGQARKEGKMPDKFIAALDKLKDKDEITYMQSIKAWKLYRMAVGDFLIDKAEEAKKLSEQLLDENDIRGSNQAYIDFRKRTDELQRFIKDASGKQSDIYTKDKKFIFPEMAQAAGVYRTSEQIAADNMGPLAEDEAATKKYEDIVKKLGAGKKVVPVEIAREVFRDFSELNENMAMILSDSEKLSRMEGLPDNFLDLNKLAERATRLREALQGVIKESGELDVVQKQNLETLVKYLKNMEALYAHKDFSAKASGVGTIPIPKFADEQMQRAIHGRNILAAQEYMRSQEAMGGPGIGEGFTYQEKVVGDTGEVVKNVMHHFRKYGETIDTTGQKVGVFTEEHQDLIEKMQRVNASFGNAIRRVVMWGAAATLIYGGVSQLKDALGEMAEIELGVAKLRMVMSQLQTDFEQMSKSAVSLGKQYGVPVTDVLASMRVFAQQGLSQSEVIDRSKTATLAANVSTLNAKDATEALTAAMKAFKEEGTESMRFLDAWSEVEAKHAITAEDMANAIKKAASAAKNAGFTFDELNGIVAGIGAVTRQSGKEVGTSMRFIARRLFSEKGPKELSKLGISTITGAGENRRGFDILHDLAGAWDNLTQAQKLNVAQAIGGTRQYNSVLVAMENWDEVLSAIKDSTDSKGSAERRNLEIMKTYAKQLEQTKAAATELKMELGKIVLPAFKVGFKAARGFLEVLTAIPLPIKAIGAALTAAFAFGAKGISIFDTIGDSIAKGTSAIGNLVDAFSNQMDVAKYEIFGKDSPGLEKFGLKTVTASAADKANVGKGAGDELVKQGEKFSDFHSTLGKMLFALTTVGRSYNEMLAGIAVTTGAVAESTGEASQRLGKFLSITAQGLDAGANMSITDMLDSFQNAAERKGLGKKAIEAMFKSGSTGEVIAKVLSKSLAYASEVSGVASYAVGQGLDTLGEKMGGAGQAAIQSFTKSNAGLIKSLSPLLLTFAGLLPTIKAAASSMHDLTMTADDYDKSMEQVRRKYESQLASIKDIKKEYSDLENKITKAGKALDPEVRKDQIDKGTFVDPFISQVKLQEEALEMTNKIAEAMPNMVAGYDKYGNAILKTAKNYAELLKLTEKTVAKSAIDEELKVLKKYNEELETGTSAENIKKTLQDLARAVPVIGEKLASNINLNPAGQLQIAVDELNKRVNIRNKYPLATVLDEDIKKAQEVVAKARKMFQDGYKDILRVRENILDEASKRNFNSGEVLALLNTEAVQKSYELELDLDIRYRNASTMKSRNEALSLFETDAKTIEEFIKNRFNKIDVSMEDLMGRDYLKMTNTGLSKYLGATASETIANLRTAGTKERAAGPTGGRVVKPGDFVSFFNSVLDSYKIAGKQAVAKLNKEGTLVAEFFNTETLKVDQVKLSEVENFVDTILPVATIVEEIDHRMDVLNMTLTGAAAGLVGITEKAFKKDFDLGSRFFSDIPTSLLLQGGKGYSVAGGYGTQDSMKNFRKEIEKFYFEPLDELKANTEILQARKEGLEESGSSIDKGTFEEINKLIETIKNNQVILQTKAIWADMMKELSASQRIMKENIAAQKIRNRLDTQSAGITKGLSKSLMGLDYGKFNIADLAPEERLLTNNAEFKRNAEKVAESDIKINTAIEQAENLAKAIVQVEDIIAQNKGFGTLISPEDRSNYLIERSQELDRGPEFEIAKSTERNTAQTAEWLQKMYNDQLANQADVDAVNKAMSSFADVFKSEPRALVDAMERIAGIRDKAEAKGDFEAVSAANVALDELSLRIFDKFENSLEDSIKYLDSYGRTAFGDRKFTNREFSGRIIDRTVGSRALIEEMEEMRGSGSLRARNPFTMRRFSQVGRFSLDPYDLNTPLQKSQEYEAFRKAAEAKPSEPIISSRDFTALSAALGSVTYLSKRGNEDLIRNLQRSLLDVNEKILQEQETQESAETPDYTRRNSLVQRKREIVSQINAKKSEASMYGMMASMSGASAAAATLAAQFGLTEGEIEAAGISAMGMYGAAVLASKVLGREMPEETKKFGKKLKELLDDKASGTETRDLDWSGLKSVGKDMVNDLSSRTKDVFGKNTQELKDEISKAKLSEGAITSALDSKAFKESLKAYTTTGDFQSERKGWADIQEKQLSERVKAFGDNIDYGSNEYKDMMKDQKAEREAYLRDLGEEAKSDVLKNYPQFDTEKFSEALVQGMTDEEGKNIVAGMKAAGIGDNKGTQLLLAALTTMISNYISDRTASDRELAKQMELAAKQSEAFANLVEKEGYGLADEALKSALKDRFGEEATVGTGPAAEKITESRLYDKEAINDAKNLLEAEIKLAEERAQSAKAERQAAAAINAHRMELERYVKASEDASRAEKQRFQQFNIDRKYSLSSVLNKQLQRFVSDVELPLSRRDMSAQQVAYAGGSRSYKDAIDTFVDASGVLDSMRQRLIEIAKDQDAAQESLATGNLDSKEAENLIESIKLLDVMYEQQADKMDSVASAMNKIGPAARKLFKFTEAVQEFSNAIEDIAVRDAVESMPGIRQMRENMDMLLGGSHPNASIPISMADERMASRVGVSLQDMVSTQYDLREAQLRDQMRTATGTDRMRISRELADLPAQRERDIRNYRQRQEDEAFSSSLQPFQDLVTGIERLKQTEEELPEKLVEYQKELVEALKNASEKLSPEQYLAEATAAFKEGKLTEDQYKKQQAIAAAADSQGVDLYRGIPQWLTNQFGTMSDDIMQSLAKLPSEQVAILKEHVSNPIVKKLEEVRQAITGEKPAEKPPTPQEYADMGFFEKIKTVFTRGFPEEPKKVKKFDPTYGYSTGNMVKGPGGPKGDKIPAMLSDGEYVIRASSVKSVGPKVLDYINTRGEVPGFAEGGEVSTWEKFKKASSMVWNEDIKPLPGKFADWLRSLGEKDPSSKAAKEAVERLFASRKMASGGMMTPERREELLRRAKEIEAQVEANKEKSSDDIWKNLFKTSVSSLENVTKSLESRRLKGAEDYAALTHGYGVGKNLTEGERFMGSMSTVLGQGAYGVGELGTRLASGVVSLGSLAESAYNKVSDRGLSGALEDAGMMAKGIYGAGKKALEEKGLKGIGSDIVNKLMSEGEKGGLSITAGVLESLIPAGAGMKLLGRGKKLATPAAKTGKVSFGDTMLNVLDKNVDKRSIEQMAAVFNEYRNILPGLTGKNIGLINIGGNYGEMKKAFGMQDSVDNALAGYMTKGKSSMFAENLGLGLAKNKSAISISSKLMGRFNLLDAFKHELMHDFFTEGLIVKEALKEFSPESIANKAGMKKFEAFFGSLKKHGIDMASGKIAAPNTNYAKDAVAAFAKNPKKKFTPISEVLAEAFRLETPMIQRLMGLFDDDDVKDMVANLVSTKRFQDFRAKALGDKVSSIKEGVALKDTAQTPSKLKESVKTMSSGGDSFAARNAGRLLKDRVLELAVGNDPDARMIANNMLKSDKISKFMGLQATEGAEFLGHGSEAIAFRVKNDKVVRLGDIDHIDTSFTEKDLNDIPQIMNKYYKHGKLDEKMVSISDVLDQSDPMFDSTKQSLSETGKNWHQLVEELKAAGGVEDPNYGFIFTGKSGQRYGLHDFNFENFGRIPEGKPGAGELRALDPGMFARIPDDYSPEDYIKLALGGLAERAKYFKQHGDESLEMGFANAKPKKTSQRYFTAYGDDVRGYDTEKEYKAASEELTNRIYEGLAETKKYTNPDGSIKSREVKNKVRFYNTPPKDAIDYREETHKNVKNLMDLANTEPEKLSDKWGIQTAMQANAAIRSAKRREGKDVPDHLKSLVAKGYAGVDGMQYNTENFEDALYDKAATALSFKERRDRSNVYRTNMTEDRQVSGKYAPESSTIGSEHRGEARKAGYSATHHYDLALKKAEQLKADGSDIKGLDSHIEKLKAFIQFYDPLNRTTENIILGKKLMDFHRSNVDATFGMSARTKRSAELAKQLEMATDIAQFAPSGANKRFIEDLKVRLERFGSPMSLDPHNILSSQTYYAARLKEIESRGLSKKAEEAAKERIEAQRQADMAKQIDKWQAGLNKMNEGFFASMNPNNGSRQVKHFGGVLSQTGTFFGQKGETVLPKGFAEGGMAEVDKTVRSAPTITNIGINVGKITSAIEEAIESAISGSELRVEDKVMRVEDKELSVNTDALEGAADQISSSLANNVSVSVDASGAAQELASAASSLSDAISSAVSNISVNVEGTVAGGPGTEEFDKIADAVKSVSDRVIAINASNTELNDKIKMIETNNETTIISRVDGIVASAVSAQTAAMQQDINDIRNDVGRVSANQRQKDLYIDSRLEEVNYRLASTMNITGIGVG